MKATMTILVFMSLILGGAMVTSALAQTDAGVNASAEGSISPVEAAEADPLGTAGDLVSAVREGNWRLVASLALALLMFGLSKVRDKIKWFKGDRGGAVLVGILGLAGAVATALAGDGPLDWKLLLGALGVTWTAVGGYTWVKRLIWPAD